jgi:hypothetical protein
MGCTEGMPLLSDTSRRVALPALRAILVILRLNTLKGDAGASKHRSTAEPIERDIKKG